MFCSGCGTEIQTGLNYCNRCGSRVGSTEPVAEILSQSVAYVGGFGLIAYIFVVLVMVRASVDMRALVMISLFYLSALFGICFLLIRQAGTFSKRKPPERQEDASVQQQAYLRPITTAQLDEPRDMGIDSVTDHTTRTLEEVPRVRE